MELIKDNKEKLRSVYRLSNGFIRKYWYNKNILWVSSHADLVNKFVPNYVYNYGENELGVWLDMYPIKGIPANIIPHTKKFVEKIYKFCLDNMDKTYPYAHGDWVLSNMFIVDEEIKLCDWDNLGIYSEQEVIEKLHSDLRSAFGDLFDEVLHDTASV